MNIFFTPDIYSDIYTLSEKESIHYSKVLRLRKNDKVILLNGIGGYYRATIQVSDNKRCIVNITENIKEFEKRDYYCHIAISPTKNIDRFEWFIEKATEIGIDEITPLICERSERKKIRHERLEKVIISAMKQSVKAYKPKLNKLTNVEELLTINNYHQKYIAHYEDKPNNLLSSKYNNQSKVIILIGPEGDFSPIEIQNARKNEFESVSLGNYRLRTETAGIVAVHTISMLNS